MADVRFLKSEVLKKSINNTGVVWSIFSKFGVDMDLKFAKRMLLLKPMVDFQLYMAAIFKVV